MILHRLITDLAEGDGFWERHQNGFAASKTPQPVNSAWTCACSTLPQSSGIPSSAPSCDFNWPLLSNLVMLNLIGIRSRLISKVFETHRHPIPTAPSNRLSRHFSTSSFLQHIKMSSPSPITTHVVDVRGADDTIFAQAVSLIQAGELVAFPTETVYGLGANALDAAATAKVRP